MENQNAKKTRIGLKKYFKLFYTSFFISAFTFGGGFVIVPLMRKKYVEDLKWLQEHEMTDLVSIAQVSPGAIAVNTSILLGYKIGGVLGALVSMFGTVLPPLIIISAISFVYNAFIQNAVVRAMMGGMQAAIAAIICDVSLKMGIGIGKEKDALSIVVMLLVFAVMITAKILDIKINVLYIILACAAISLAAYFIRKKFAKKAASIADEKTEKVLEGQLEQVIEETEKTDDTDIDENGENGGAQ